MRTLCVLVVMLGIGALALGLTLYRWRHAVDVGVEADQELLDRMSRTLNMNAGVATSMDSYAHSSLAYHQSVQHLYMLVVRILALGGGVLILTGSLQLRALRTLGSAVRDAQSPANESTAT